ncbi:cytochrome P450 [Kitasatospora kifunensis]|uniref:Cytochrome P450 n=1 Tax=Kitasatospora kifunensis TaxID=58351 RepID=A0A7W7R9R5_KITKI|nr:cytochrome P450 [Kitasatospora kifunensis]MBB4927698.1 cytochrome P450 [Kitasatospora kifunensis]
MTAPVDAPLLDAPLRPVAGPRGVPLLGSLAAFGRDPLSFMVRLREEFGDFVTWRLGPRRCVLLSHPQHIAELLGAAERDFQPVDIGWAFHQVAGESVAVLRGEQWRRKRAVVQPVVRPHRVRGYAPTMASCTIAHADGWREGQRVDVQEEMAAITQQIVAQTLFGDSPHVQGSGLRQAMATVQREIAAEVRGGVGLFLPDWVRTPARRRVLAACSVIDQAINRFIRERRAQAAEPDGQDMLATLLAQRDEQGQPLSDAELRDEAVTLWIGGQETTATTLVWAWQELSGAPQVRARLTEEVQRVLAGRAPTYEDYDQLPYTRQVVREALRLYPPVWTLCVIARHDTSVGGIPVPAGTMVWASQWSVHRDPRWFTDPQAFRPERFAADAPDPAADHTWFPFGSGPRACFGARFAQVTAVLVLAALAQRFHLEIPPGRVTPRPGFLLQPAAPILATVREVRGG